MRGPPGRISHPRRAETRRRPPTCDDAFTRSNERVRTNSTARSPTRPRSVGYFARPTLSDPPGGATADLLMARRASDSLFQVNRVSSRVGAQPLPNHNRSALAPKPWRDARGHGALRSAEKGINALLLGFALAEICMPFTPRRRNAGQAAPSPAGLS